MCGVRSGCSTGGSSLLDELLNESLEVSPAASGVSSTVSQLVASFLDASAADSPAPSGEASSCQTMVALPNSLCVWSEHALAHAFTVNIVQLVR